MYRNRTHRPVIMAVVTVMLVGCDNRDQRLADLAEQTAQLQTSQNEEMSRLNREVAAGTRQLVEASGTTTDKLLTMQSELQQEHSQLESERRSLAKDRARDAILGPVISVLGFTLISLLPLLVCWRLLSHLQHEPQEAEICDLLIDELSLKEEKRDLLARAEHSTSLFGPTSPGPADEH